MKLLCIKIIMIVCICSGVFAASPSVVVQMAQHDEDRDSLRETTFILENGVLDVFFDAGYVVSSLPTSVNKDIAEILKDTTKIARAGYMNYVVYINVYFRDYDGSKDETITLDDIESVDWKVVHTKDMSVLGEGKTVKTEKMPGENDLLAMRRFSNELGAQIQREFENIL